jgi:hypothetical protein
MNPRAVLFAGCLTVTLVACNLRTAPPAAAIPFEAHSDAAKALRSWVTDPLPAGTTLVGYQREDAWDGTVWEEWMLNSPDGFSSLRQAGEGRELLQVPADAPYKVLDARLTALGVRYEGGRPSRVWHIDWRTTAHRTSVSGNLYPHAAGELLRVERVSLR